MIDSICRAQGYRTGLFTSPHLVTFRERIRVNGEMISEDAVADGLTIIRDLVADWDPHPTFFEVTTALALKHFSDPENAELNMTAFNSAHPRLIAINSMLLFLKPALVADSMRPTLFNPMFQSLLRSISIMKNGSEIHWLRLPVKKQELLNPEFRSFRRAQQPEAEEVIRARAAECGAPVQFVNETYHRSPIALRGEYQKQNAAVAIAAIHGGEHRARAKKRLCADLRPSNGLRVFRNGTSAPSSMARIIPARRAFSRKRGAKFLVIRRRRSFSRFFPTKICAVSAKRSRRLPVR